MAYMNESQFHIKQKTEEPFNVDVFMNDGTHRKRKISLTTNSRRHKDKPRHKNDVIKSKKIDKHLQIHPVENCSSIIFSDHNMRKDKRGVDVSFWNQCNANREAFELNYIQNLNDVNFDEYKHYLQRKKERKARKNRKEKYSANVAQEKIDIPNMEESKSVTTLKTEQKTKQRTKHKAIRIENDPIRDIFESESFLQLNPNTSNQNIPPYFKTYLDEVNNMMDAKLEMFFKNIKLINKKKSASKHTKNPLENSGLSFHKVVSNDSKADYEFPHDSRKINLKTILHSHEYQTIPTKEDVTTQSSKNFLAVKSNHDLKKKKTIKQSSLLNIPEEHINMQQINEEPEKLQSAECKKNNPEVNVPKSVGTEIVESSFEEKKKNLICETIVIVEIPSKPTDLFSSVDDYIENKKNSLAFKRYYGDKRPDLLYYTASDCHKPFMGSTDTSDKNSEEEKITEDVFIRTPPILSSKTSNNELKCMESVKKLSPITSSKQIKKCSMRVSHKFYKKHKKDLLESKQLLKMCKEYFNTASSQSSCQYKNQSVGSISSSELNSGKRTSVKEKRRKKYELSEKHHKTCKDKKSKKKHVKHCSCQYEKTSTSSDVDERLNKRGRKHTKTTACQYYESESTSSSEFRRKERRKSTKNEIQNMSSQSDSELMIPRKTKFHNSEEKFRKHNEKKRNTSADYKSKKSEDRRQNKNKNFMDDKTFTDNKKTKKNEGSIKNKTISKVKLSKSDLQIRKRKNSKARSKSDVDIRSDHNYSKINSTVTLDPFEKNGRTHSINSERNCVPLYQQLRSNCLMLTKNYKNTDKISAYDKRKMYDDDMKRKRWKKKTDDTFTKRQYDVRFITVDNAVQQQEDIIKLPINDTPKHVAVHYKKRTPYKKDEAITCKLIETPSTKIHLLQNYNDVYLKDNNLLTNKPLENRFYPFIDDLRWKFINFYSQNDRPSVETFKTIESQKKKKKISVKFHPKSYTSRCRKTLKNNAIYEKNKMKFLMVNNNFKTDETSTGTTCPTTPRDQTSNMENNKNIPLIGTHCSCPTIRNHESMFDFLYDNSSEITDILRPLHTVMATPATVISPTLRKPSCTDSQSYKSSMESGYNSVNSRKHFSFSNFFKQANIMALFNPPQTLNANENENNVLFFDHKKDHVYQKMAEECKSFVTRPREHCKVQNADQKYEEIPLSVILRNANSKTDKKCAKTANSNGIFDKNTVQISKSFLELVPLRRNIADLSSEEGNENPRYEEMSLNDILGKSNSKMTTSNNKYSNEVLSVNYEQSLNNKSTSSETLSSIVIQENGLKLVFFKSNENLTKEMSFTNSSTSFCNFETLCRLYEKLLCSTFKLSQDEDFFHAELISAINEMNARLRKKRKLKNLFKKKTKTSSVTSFFTSLTHETIMEQMESAHSYNKLNDLQTAASNVKRYYSLLVHAVRSNQSITDELKIYGFLSLLNRIENGDYTLLLQSEDEAHFQLEIKMQIKRTFLMAYNCCLEETKKHKRNITEQNINLLRILASRFNPSSDLHIRIIATSIGKGFIKTEKQLKAGLIYLIRMNTNEINEKDFVQFCHENNYN